MEQTKSTETSNVQTAAELLKKYGTKSAAIRELFAQGKTKGEISKALGISYQHAYNVLKQAANKAEVKTVVTASEGLANERAKPVVETAKAAKK